MLKKILKKIREGYLREIICELRWIYGYAREYKASVLFYTLLGVFAALLGLGSSLAGKYLIDAVTGHKNSLILSIALIYAGLGLGRIALSAFTKRIAARISVKSANHIRSDVFGRFLFIDWQASLDYHSGDLLTRINSDVSSVSDSILGLIPGLVVGLVQFAGTLVIILIYDPVMALIALLSAPVTVLMSRYLLGNMRSFGEKMRRTQAELTSFFEEALQNLQAIKAFSLSGNFHSRLHQLQSLYRSVSLDYNLFSVKVHSLLSVIGFVVSGLCFAWGVYRLWSGSISFGTMVLFIQLAGLLSSSFSGLVSLVPGTVSATVAARRIMTILELPREDLSLDGPSALLMEKAPREGLGVQVSSISFSYKPGREVFSGLSLQACPGEIIGIVSPSGGGKTSLIRALLCLVKPQSGSIRFTSGELSVPLCPGLRPLISYVAQEKVIFSGTVADCLRLGCPDADEQALEKALRLACAWDFVSALPQGLDTHLGERGLGLSEGQLQRLAIARALLSPAPLLLLDEATSALDTETEEAVLRGIVSSARGRTLILTTHRPSLLSACTRVYSIENGAARLLSPEEIAARQTKIEQK